MALCALARRAAWLGGPSLVLLATAGAPRRSWAQALEEDAGVSQETDAGPPGALRPPVWQDPGAAPWPDEATPGVPVDVWLRVTVSAEGDVTEVSVQETDAARVFERAAEDFVRAHRFEPATQDGAPIPANVTLRVHFEPPADDPDPAPDGASKSDEPFETSAYGAEAQIESGTHPASTVAASDLHIEVGALHEVPRRDAMQLLTLAPGVVLTNHAGEGHAYAAFLRGFDAGEGQDLEVRVAGIPINEPSNAHAHGYADSHFVIPELVHSVRVLEGPFDARQGDFAAAGTAAFSLAAQEPGVRVQAGMGSYGRRRLLAVWSPSNTSRDNFAAVDLTDGDGFGPNRAHANVRALGQLSGRSRRLDYRLLVASHALRFDSVGVVREDAVEREGVSCGGADMDPFYCFLDPNQGGQASRHLASLELRGRLPDAEWSQQLTWMYRQSRFRENFTGELLDPRGDAVDAQTHTVTLVGGGHYRVERRWRARPQIFEIGYEGRYDTGDARMWRVRRDGQVPYETVFDHDVGLTRVSVYALGELALADWLGLTLGGRVDTFGYDVLDRDQPSSDREGERLPMQSVSAWGTNWQPRVSLRVGPRSGLSWISSFGIGSRSSDAAALSEGENAPFTRIWSGESGLWSQIHRDALESELRAAFFYAHVDRDLLFDETRGRNVSIGATNRYGAYGHARIGVGEHLDSSASFTWAEAYHTDDGVGFETGPRLPFVPRFVARGDVALSESVPTRWDPLALSAGLGVSWVGPRPLPLETAGHSIFNLDASLRVRLRMVEVSLEGTNLTGRKNRSAEYFYASDFGTGGPTRRRVQHFSAAPPRQFMANVAVIFDPAPATEPSP